MGAAAGSSEQILVVEDEHLVLNLVTHILKDAGYSVLTALSGDEALQITRQQAGQIDLLLTDIIMPGMSGGELVGQIMSLQPEMRVLYMSGYTKYTVVKHGTLESVDSFIWKPFSPESLLQKVREVLDAPRPHPDPEAGRQG
jgi:CheY-like chemotaxis protein